MKIGTALSLLSSLAVFCLWLSTGAPADTFFQSALDDLVEFAPQEDSFLQHPAILTAAEDNQVGYRYEYDNTVQSGPLTLQNHDQCFDLVMPLSSLQYIPESSFGVSFLQNKTVNRVNYNGSAFDFGGQSDAVRVVYGVRLSDRLSVGCGVDQYRNPALEARHPACPIYAVQFAFFPGLVLGYQQGRQDAGTLAKINYAGHWNDYPLFGTTNRSEASVKARLGSKIDVLLCGASEKTDPYASNAPNYGLINNITDSANLTVNFNANERICWQGRMGREKTNELVDFYDGGQGSAYLETDRDNLFYSLGVTGQAGEFDLGVGWMSACLDVSGRGRAFAEDELSFFSDADYYGKLMDIGTKINSSGLRFTIKRKPMENGLAWRGNLSLLTLNLVGGADVWNTLFFGAVKEKDASYAVPVQRVDVLIGELGLAYKVQSDLTINYAFKQFVPVRVVGDSGAGMGSGSAAEDNGAVSGGNTQKLSLAYSF
jgi:hypothetical protein